MPSFLKLPKIAVIVNKFFKRNWRILLSSCGRRESPHLPWKVSLCKEKTKLTSSVQPSNNTKLILSSVGLKMMFLLNNRSTREHSLKVRVHRDNRLLLNFKISRHKTGLIQMRATLTCLTHRVQAWSWEIKDRPVSKEITWGKATKIMAAIGRIPTSQRREIGKTQITINNY